MAHVVALGAAPRRAAPVEPRSALEVAVGVGVVGDRYSSDEGTWNGYPDMEVTLAAEEDAEAVGLRGLDLRRNVVTRGVDLDALVGRTFRVGDALLHGMRRCDPCTHLEGLLGRRGLKDALHGGLRARVVRGGTVCVGDAVEAVQVVLDGDVRAVVEAAHLAFVATVTPDGRPNLSPKGTIRVLDDHRLFYLDIASARTRRNLEANPWMEVNVVDGLSRRGYRFAGTAALHKGDDVHAAAEKRVFEEDGAEYPNRGAVVLTVERALPLVSPGYRTTEDEHAMRGAWAPKRRALDDAFTRHVEARGAFRLGRG